jgi:hypothetical protein
MMMNGGADINYFISIPPLLETVINKDYNNDQTKSGGNLAARAHSHAHTHSLFGSSRDEQQRARLHTMRPREILDFDGSATR